MTWDSKRYTRSKPVFRAPAAQLMAQERRAYGNVKACLEYAESIGCVVLQDEIVTTNPEQIPLLKAWWAENMS